MNQLTAELILPSGETLADAHSREAEKTRGGGAVRPWMFVLIGFAWLGVLAIRLAAPSDFMDNDQQRPAAYVMDAARNGHWLTQRDWSGDIASKPPVYTWLAAAAGLAAGRQSLFTVYLPCALATLGLALLILGMGGRFFGAGAGFLAAVMFLFSPAGLKMILLARTDTLFALETLGMALMAWRAWVKRKSWTLFWLMAALATLTKGPLGVALGAGGLLAARWAPVKRREGERPPWRRHLPGVALFFALAGGWFLAAWLHEGRPLIDKLIGRELVGHALHNDKGGGFPGALFYLPPMYFLSRFAPWSLLAAAGLWRVLRRPSAGREERRFELFLACQFLAGLAIFAFSPHQRPDLLFPLLPAAAMLAGREASRLLTINPMASRGRLLGGIAGLQLGVMVYYFAARGRTVEIVRTEGMRELAEKIRERVGGAFPLTHVDTPYALQFFLGTMRPKTPLAAAARAFEDPAYAAFAVVSEPRELEQALGGAKLHEVAAWSKGELAMRVVSNRPGLDYEPRMAAAFGDAVLFMDGLHLTRVSYDELTLRAKGLEGSARVVNAGERPLTLKINILNTRPETHERITLAPGAERVFSLGQRRVAGAPLRVGMIADCRQAHAQLARLSRLPEWRSLDCVVVNGDFVFESDWQYDIFMEHARRWGMPVFPVIGNHDILPETAFPYDPFLNRMGYARHSFAAGPAHMAFLETGTKQAGGEQIEFLRGAAFAGAAPGAARLLFMHVPPNALASNERGQGAASEERRLLEAAGEAGARRIYCGHRNRFERLACQTVAGPVEVLIAGCGGEKTHKKNYQQQWLELRVTEAGVEEIQHPMPTPGRLRAAWARLAHCELRRARIEAGKLAAAGNKAFAALRAPKNRPSSAANKAGRALQA